MDQTKIGNFLKELRKEDSVHVKKLLRETGAAVKNSEFAKAEQEYNIFRVLECDGREVMMCRMLADLLSPHGQHGMGNTYLKKFLEDVLHERMRNI